MRQIVHIEYRCAKHERREDDCADCALVQQFENEAEGLRVRREKLLEKIRKAIFDKRVAICGIR